MKPYVSALFIFFAMTGCGRTDQSKIKNESEAVATSPSTLSESPETSPLREASTTAEVGGCSTPNTYNSHVLAISWQSAFCEIIKPSKPECKNLDDEPYATSHFTLHGLWPNKNGCGHSYGFCGEVKNNESNFCDFPKIAGWDPKVWKELEKVMPSAKYGSCLQRHEWWKHGTCRDTNANSYYELAIRLLSEINTATFVTEFVAPNIGKEVTLTEFNRAFEKSFGENTSTRIGPRCKNGVMTELQINLPKQLSTSTPLADLIKEADTNNGNCGPRFRIAALD